MPGLKDLSSVSHIFACGTALFSDGYANSVIGAVLERIYGSDVMTANNHSKAFTSVTFAGTVVGMLIFGWVSDKIGRKFGMISATGIVALFILSAASAGANNSVAGMLAMLAACRFLIGIGIGAGYPCGTVSASEQSEEGAIAKNAQHRFGNNHIRAVWRLSLGLGVVPALAVLLWRLRMTEPLSYKDSMKSARIPYWLVVKRYWKGLFAPSPSWFTYDFISYTYISSTITNNVTGNNTSSIVVFGWSVVVNLFYMSSTIIGAFLVDYWGPKATMIAGLLAQAIVYGIFLSFGEFDLGGDKTAKGNTGPFLVGSGLAILSALVVFFLVRPLSYDGMKEEDVKFRMHLEGPGFDTSLMGVPDSEVSSTISEEEKAAQTA
ncbi:hypothetical protein PAXINDRAFT_163069 [Paxillus involutus ATCC 200175]|uniref:Major facilitator superfamily (MFS) profile domain-containing protein n=1 Tax=Paxillus involutus ATCC 200175 TaxID=664439 RepID=A0A0C9TZA2_PAXIN|nr:hypothetical protein PAXINDRAFT_163069 [Paxillus involutus ATCC 200175]